MRRNGAGRNNRKKGWQDKGGRNNHRGKYNPGGFGGFPDIGGHDGFSGLGGPDRFGGWGGEDFFRDSLPCERGLGRFMRGGQGGFERGRFNMVHAMGRPGRFQGFGGHDGIGFQDNCSRLNDFNFNNFDRHGLFDRCNMGYSDMYGSHQFDDFSFHDGYNQLDRQGGNIDDRDCHARVNIAKGGRFSRKGDKCSRKGIKSTEYDLSSSENSSSTQKRKTSSVLMSTRSYLDRYLESMTPEEDQSECSTDDGTSTSFTGSSSESKNAPAAKKVKTVLQSTRSYLEHYFENMEEKLHEASAEDKTKASSFGPPPKSKTGPSKKTGKTVLQSTRSYLERSLENTEPEAKQKSENNNGEKIPDTEQKTAATGETPSDRLSPSFRGKSAKSKRRKTATIVQSTLSYLERYTETMESTERERLKGEAAERELQMLSAMIKPSNASIQSSNDNNEAEQLQWSSVQNLSCDEFMDMSKEALPRGTKKQTEFDEKIARLKVTIPLQSLIGSIKLSSSKPVHVEDFRSLVGQHKNIKAFCYFVRHTDPNDSSVRVVECQLYINDLFISSAQRKITRTSPVDLSEAEWSQSKERQAVINDTYLKAWHILQTSTVEEICNNHRLLKEDETPEGAFSQLFHGMGRHGCSNSGQLLRQRHPFKPVPKSNLTNLVLVQNNNAALHKHSKFQVLNWSCTFSGLLMEWQFVTDFGFQQNSSCSIYINKVLVATASGKTRDAAKLQAGETAVENLKKKQPYVEMLPPDGPPQFKPWEEFLAEAEAWFDKNNSASDASSTTVSTSSSAEKNGQLGEKVSDIGNTSAQMNVQLANMASSGTVAGIGNQNATEKSTAAVPFSNSVHQSNISQIPLPPPLPATIDTTHTDVGGQTSADQSNQSNNHIQLSTRKFSGSNNTMDTSSFGQTAWQQTGWANTNNNAQPTGIGQVSNTTTETGTIGQAGFTQSAWGSNFSNPVGDHNQSSQYGTYLSYDQYGYCYIVDYYGNWAPYSEENAALFMYGQSHPSTQPPGYLSDGSSNQTTGYYGNMGQEQLSGQPAAQGQWNMTQQQSSHLGLQMPSANASETLGRGKQNKQSGKLCLGAIPVQETGKFEHSEPLLPPNDKVLQYLTHILKEHTENENLDEVYICAGMPLGERQALDLICMKLDYKLMCKTVKKQVLVSAMPFLTSQEVLACLRRHNGRWGKLVLVSDPSKPQDRSHKITYADFL